MNNQIKSTSPSSVPHLFKSDGFLPPMTTFAQNFEDVTLRRAFLPQNTGFYIDIGAYHPISHSVTQHFYLNGWSGINVEANPKLIEAFYSERPRDTNLSCAVGSSTSKSIPLHILGDTGLTTTLSNVADSHVAFHGAYNSINVPVISLSELIGKYAGNKVIDFLKVDVEGAEFDVLKSLKFETYRPRIIVFECSSIYEIHELLINSEYNYAWFDGLNLYYVRNEDSSLMPLIARPPSVWDNIEKIQR